MHFECGDGGIRECCQDRSQFCKASWRHALMAQHVRYVDGLCSECPYRHESLVVSSHVLSPPRLEFRLGGDSADNRILGPGALAPNCRPFVRYRPTLISGYTKVSPP
jgi:hypothetical protein